MSVGTSSDPRRLFDVAGRGALVTGAASGLGRAVARVLARNGARVTLVDRNERPLEEVRAELAAEGTSVRVTVADVTDDGAVRAAMRDAAHWTGGEAATAGGGLDIVFANAGVSSGPGHGVLVRDSERGAGAGSLDTIDDERWRGVLEVNLTGTMHTVRAAAAHLNEGTGRIVVVSSVAGLRPDPLVGYAYSSSKAAVALFARNAAAELAPRGIAVNVIAPGAFLTPIGARNPEGAMMLQAMTEATALKRLADPGEIEGLALLLSSPASSHITGSVFVIDGGIMLGS